MRLFLLLGCVAAAATGCNTTRCSTKCQPCSKAPTASCSPVAPGAPTTPSIPPAKNGPTYLPPTIREVRGEEFGEPRTQAAMNPDVLLIPRWVYVPYSPHMPTGPSKLPANVAGPQSMAPYLPAGNQMTVLPPMGAPVAQQNDTMEQCLAQMKLLNVRMADLEAKQASRPAATASYQTPAMPHSLPLPPLPAPTAVIPIPPAK
jgi:hypothetical protein